MKQLIQNFNDGEVRMEKVPVPQVTDGSVLVKTTHSCLSAGTETAMIKLGQKNALSKAYERPDLAKQVISKARNDGIILTYQAVKGRLEKPEPLGYSSAGRVVEVGDTVDTFQVGDRVACAGAGYASHAEFVSVPENLVATVPEEVPLADAAFTTIGSIAMQGIRRAELTPGERVGVIGLGLVGQLCIAILDAYGFPTIGFDIQSRQIEKAKEVGLDTGMTLGSGNAETEVDELTNGKGLDAVIIAASTSSNNPVELAGDIAREQGTISVIGDVGMDIPRSKYYDKELDFNISRSYGPGRYDRSYEEDGLDYPLEHVRWTENRNMQEFLRLIRSEGLSLDSIKTHEFEFDDATSAYDMILSDSTEEYYSGIILEYSDNVNNSSKLLTDSVTKSSTNTELINTGVIGAGTFARSKILPILTNLDNVDIRAVASRTGKTAADVAQEHDAVYATSDPEDVIEDPDIDLVVIATRHDSHASLAIAALEEDKNVHLEKPLCIDTEDLQKIVQSERESHGRLMVGYNRRFTTEAKELKEASETSEAPLLINYRVAADPLPSDHWVRDPSVGGGRIIGEVCHFVDFAQYITSSHPVSVYATTLGQPETEDVSIQIKHKDGSVANIQYIISDNSSVSKEYIEVVGSSVYDEIDNFNQGYLSLRQNKGHKREFEEFLTRITNGGPSPISIEELVSTSLSTFAVRKSISQRAPVSIPATSQEIIRSQDDF